jgi:hypothetical protein
LELGPFVLGRSVVGRFVVGRFVGAPKNSTAIQTDKKNCRAEKKKGVK